MLMAFIVLRHHGVNANGMSLRGIGMTTKSPWRPGLTQDRLVDELDRFATVPGLANIWVPPIRNRDRKSTRLNSSHWKQSRMPSSA